MDGENYRIEPFGSGFLITAMTGESNGKREACFRAARKELEERGCELDGSVRYNASQISVGGKNGSRAQNVKMPKENGAIRLGKAFLELIPVEIRSADQTMGTPMKVSEALKDALKKAGGSEAEFIAHLEKLADGGKNIYHLAVSLLARSRPPFI